MTPRVRRWRRVAAPGDTFLVKASRGAALDELVEELVAAGGGTLEGAGGVRRVTGMSVTAGAMLVVGCLVAFFVAVLLFPPFIRLIRSFGMGKRIRVDGPESHYSKEGTPTMGGLLIILVVAALVFVLELARPGFIDPGTFAPLATLVLVGALGTVDDWLNARTGDGIRVRQKLVWQIVVALLVAYQIQDTYDLDAVVVPFLGTFGIEPWLYIAFAAFAIVATSNAVNITDGLDGLSGGTLVFAFIGFMAIAALNQPLSQPNLAILCAIIIGALLGFLWFNVHPAEVFIGDSGALGLGATLAVVALITGQIMLLPVIGFVFVARDGPGHRPDPVVQVEGPAAVPDGTAPSPLRAHRLARTEDHHPLLDRGRAVGARGRGLLPRHAGDAPLSGAVATVEPIDIARIDLDSFAGRPVAVLGLARSGIALCSLPGRPRRPGDRLRRAERARAR